MPLLCDRYSCKTTSTVNWFPTIFSNKNIVRPKKTDSKKKKKKHLLKTQTSRRRFFYCTDESLIELRTSTLFVNLFIQRISDIFSIDVTISKSVIVFFPWLKRLHYKQGPCFFGYRYLSFFFFIRNNLRAHLVFWQSVIYVCNSILKKKRIRCFVDERHRYWFRSDQSNCYLLFVVVIHASRVHRL